MPLVRPVTVHDFNGYSAVHCLPPGVETTPTWDVTDVHETTEEALAKELAVTLAGAAGG